MSTKKSWSIVGIFLLVITALVTPALGAGQVTASTPLTTGGSYDRNPTLLQDGKTTWLFFARSEQAPCNRLIDCNADNTQYDLYAQQSLDGGRTWSPATMIETNPKPVGTQDFRGRTVAATQTADGTIWVFWATGADSSYLYYYSKAPGSTTWTSYSPLTDHGYFNVHVVAKRSTVYVYAEVTDGGVPLANGVYVRTFDGTGFSDLQPVAIGLSIPKVIVDRRGIFRMAMVNGNVGDVYLASSVDGITWSAPVRTVQAAAGTTNWDPSLVQLANGSFFLFYAPDLGNGSQQIEVRSSDDFMNWSAPFQVTSPAAYWDYWPNATAHGNQLQLYYTSERGIGNAPAGTGHIWTFQLSMHQGD